MDLKKLYTVCNDIVRKIKPCLKLVDGVPVATQKEIYLITAHRDLWMALFDDAMGVEE